MNRVQLALVVSFCTGQSFLLNNVESCKHLASRNLHFYSSQYLKLKVLFQNTQISSADPRRIKRSHTFHVRTCERDSFGEFTMATDSQEELTKWWDALQQHLLDQGIYKLQTLLHLSFLH